MNLNLFTSFLVTGLIAFCVTLTGCKTADTINTRSDLVQLAPAVAPEYCTPEFWIKRNKDADKIILTEEGIKAFNKAIADLPVAKVKNLEEVSDRFNGKTLQEELVNFKVPTTPFIVDGQQIDSTNFVKMVKERILSIKTEEDMPVQYGFAVNRTYIREIPYEKNVCRDFQTPDWDVFASTGVAVNEPLLVYFTTPDNVFSYIEINTYFGWIFTKDIAICKNKDEWLDHKNAKDFLVITGQKVYLEPCLDKDISEKFLNIGTKLPLVSNKETVNGRHPWHDYVVKLPCRDQEGHFYAKDVTIPINRDVSVGYLPFTLRNVYTEAFKCLGNTYGWGGMLNGQDCSGFVQEVYKTVGIELPRDTFQQRYVPGFRPIPDDATVEERCSMLDEAPPGSALYMPRHANLYLGEVDGEYYVINSCTGVTDYSTVNGEEQKEVNMVHRVVINSLVRSHWVSRVHTIVPIR